MLRGKGLRAAAVVLAALVFVPAAFAHHPVHHGVVLVRRTRQLHGDGVGTNSGLPGQPDEHATFAIFETKVNGAALNPTVQVGSGAFNTADNYSFSGSFSVDSSVSASR